MDEEYQTQNVFESKPEPLLPKPEPPLPSDCCGSGCSPCVHDIYDEDLRAWKKSCKELSLIGKGECDESLSNSNSEEILCHNRFKPFKLINIKKVSEDTSVYIFELPNNSSLGLKVGQHIIIQGASNDKIITRSYTPINDEEARGMFDVMVKLYVNGKMSSIISKWKVGDLVDIKGPFGKFKYESNSYKRVLMLAAGTGIAPMYQVLKYILQNEEDMTKIHVMYASKSFKDILLREELYALQSYWNVTVCHFLSREERMQDKKYSENVQLRKMCKRDVTDDILKFSPQQTLVLISGTKSFDKDMVNAALDACYDCKKNIFRF